MTAKATADGRQTAGTSGEACIPVVQRGQNVHLSATNSQRRRQKQNNCLQTTSSQACLMQRASCTFKLPAAAASLSPKTPKTSFRNSTAYVGDLQNTFWTNSLTSHVWSRLSSFESRKSFENHTCIILRQILNASLHLSLHKELRLQKSKVFGRHYHVFGKSPRISPKGHQNKRPKESALVLGALYLSQKR